MGQLSIPPPCLSSQFCGLSRDKPRSNGNLWAGPRGIPGHTVSSHFLKHTQIKKINPAKVVSMVFQSHLLHSHHQSHRRRLPSTFFRLCPLLRKNLNPTKRFPMSTRLIPCLQKNLQLKTRRFPMSPCLIPCLQKSPRLKMRPRKNL